MLGDVEGRWQDCVTDELGADDFHEEARSTCCIGDVGVLRVKFSDMKALNLAGAEQSKVKVGALKLGLVRIAGAAVHRGGDEALGKRVYILVDGGGERERGSFGSRLCLCGRRRRFHRCLFIGAFFLDLGNLLGKPFWLHF